jgi:hypothetical protein
MIGKREMVLAAAAMAAMVLMAGCMSDSSSNPVGPRNSNSAAVRQLLLSNPQLTSFNPWNDDAVVKGQDVDTVLSPVSWARIGTLSDVNTDVQFQGDSLATITLTSTFDGKFEVVNSDKVPADSRKVIKPMFNTIVRKMHAVRPISLDAPDPSRQWRVTEVTPFVMMSSDQSPNTVMPTHTRVYARSNGDLTLIADIGDPLNTYFKLDSLPSLAAGQDLVVMVTSSLGGATPVVAALHPRTDAVKLAARTPMNDAGALPDQTPRDGVYSGVGTAPDQVGEYVATVDLIRVSTIFDSDGPYDSGAWGIPYRVALTTTVAPTRPIAHAGL